MDQQELFKPVPRHKLESLTHEQMIEFMEVQQKVIEDIQKDNDRLKNLYEQLRQKKLRIEEQFITLKNKYFGKSSEKEPSNKDRQKNLDGQNKKNKKVQLPSDRYPEAPLIERDVELEETPSCKCCGSQMTDSGLTENSEFLTAIPTQFMVIRQKRHKYRCGKCHGDVQTAPAPPRISPGSSYSDEMIIDVAMSKYCDLIPIERYASMAGRQGLMDLPPQSLIEQTHKLANFVYGAYQGLRSEALCSRTLQADETPHRMLEGSEKKNWHLWGFSTPETSFFEIHDTRSGDVASDLLRDSACQYLISDVFSGYNKAVTQANKERKSLNRPLIKNVYCNAHARRKFKTAAERFPEESQYFVDMYKKIYRLEKIAQARPPDRVVRVRRYMKSLFEQMKNNAMQQVSGYSSKSSIGKAMNYFLKNYDQLTLFIDHGFLPIDNNLQERLLRSPVVGRKTWYGTHSKRGAQTAACLFSLVESCKLNGINPRDYFKTLVENLHAGKEPFTPKQFKSSHPDVG